MALTLASERYGEGGASQSAPMLIAHGLFGAGRNWMSLARRFAESRQVATVDLRNHGASPWGDETDYLSLGQDLLQTAEALFARPAILLGHSMGGKAAMAAALQAPEQVAGLIVADVAPVAYSGHQHGVYVEAMRRADLSGVSRRSQIEPQLVEAIPDAALRAFILANLAFEETPEGRRARWRVNLDALGEGMADVIGWPEALDEKSYSGPSYFLAGGASDYVDAAGAQHIHALFPNAAIDALEGAGHWLHAEQPDPFFERVSGWLRQRGM